MDLEPSTDDDISKPSGGLTKDEAKSFCSWLKDTLGEDKVTAVEVSSRLVTHPAIVSDDAGAGEHLFPMPPP